MHDASRLHPHHADDLTEIDPRRRTIAVMVPVPVCLTTAVDITITNVALPFIGEARWRSQPGCRAPSVAISPPQPGTRSTLALGSATS